MNAAGIPTVAANTTKQKNKTTNPAVCSNQLSRLVENDCKLKNSGPFSSLSSGFQKILLRSDAELNYLDKLKMIGWNTLDVT